MSGKYKHKTTVFENKLFDSPVWNLLTKTATDVYIIFMRMRNMKEIPKKSGKWVNTNNDTYVLTYRTAKEKHGIPEVTFTRAIDLLIELGMIDIIKHGSGTARTETVYGISDRWRNYGTPKFVRVERTKVKVGKCGRRPNEIHCGYGNL